MDAVSRFADRHLGKGVVVAKDSPNFIANHSGSSARCGRSRAGSRAFTIEEIDAITGPAIGRPKSATFRTMDIAGLDVLARRDAQSGGAARRRCGRGRCSRCRRSSPRWCSEDGSASKTGQGFYKKVGRRDPDPRSTGDGLPAAAARAPGVDRRGAEHGTVGGPHPVPVPRRRTEPGNSCATRSGRLLLYTARVTPDIAYSIDDVDRAMRWGFGWELGPFETWDAIGVARVIEACGATDLPPLAAEALARGAFRPAAARRRRQPGAPSVAGCRDPAHGEGGGQDRPQQRRVQPGRSRRRRAGGRVPLEDEHHRRRHDRDARGRRPRSRPPTSGRSWSATRR